MNAIELDKIRLHQKTTSLKEKTKSSSFLDLLSKDIKLSSSRFSDKKKERFYSQLNILISAGVDIKTTLELIVDEQKEEDKEMFVRIKEMVINGSSLSDALEKTGKFSDYEVCSIRIGEESGKLSDVLKEQNAFFGKKIAHRRQLMSVISYPIIVISVACGAGKSIRK